MPQYIPAPEVQEIAKDIISKHRPELKPLKISYMFRPEAAISNGIVTVGMCIRPDDRNYLMHQHDFIVEIAKDVWDDATTDFRIALVDHELGHCGIRMDGDEPEVDPSGRLKTFTRKHEIEEFADVLERHGAYHSKLREFIAAHAKNASSKKAKKDPGAEADEESEG